jgi:hypothetical protein
MTRAFKTPTSDVSISKSREVAAGSVELDYVESLALQAYNGGVQAFFELCVDRGNFRTCLGEICFNDDQGVRLVQTDFQLFGK